MPKCNVNDITTEGWRAEVSWRPDGQDGNIPGHVQVATVNQASMFEFPAVGEGSLRVEAEPFDGWRVTLDEAGIDRMIVALKKARAAAFSPEKDPEVGDRVFLQGSIIGLHEGVALVEVYRSWPLAMRVPVQCGALEHDDRMCDPGSQPVPGA